VRVIEILGRLRGVFPLTTRGALIAALAAFALMRVAYESLDFVVLTLAYSALGLVGLGVLAVIVGAFVMKVKVAPPVGESRLLTDRFLPTEFGLPSTKLWPLLEVDAELTAPRFERREDDGRELVRATHRGLFAETVREIVVRDAFGLAELRFPLRGGGLYALPHLGKLEPSVALLSLSVGDDFAHPHGTPDGDRIELRRYVAGDPARYIHWKIFARSGELVVRMPEHAIKSADRVAIYFIAGEGDEPSSAVALALARSSDLESRVIFGCDGTNAPIRSVADAERAITQSHGHRGSPGAEAFMKRVDAQGPAALVLIVPAIPGPWLGAATELVRARPGGARILVGIDGMEDETSSFFERVMLRRDRSARATSSEGVAKVAATFRAAGAEVILLDRVSGRMLDALPRRRAAA
jgi:hypothetical protein